MCKLKITSTQAAEKHAGRRLICLSYRNHLLAQKDKMIQQMCIALFISTAIPNFSGLLTYVYV